ncbi:MAG: phage holin family protein [Synergistaceae bacterium]|nr:phage holin family protein [Synergistaceae bacterium]
MSDEFSEFVIAGFFGLMGWFFGGLDGFIKVLICCTVVDYVTGICKAGKEGKISSRVAFWGIARKIVMFLFVGLANVIDKYLLDGKEAFRAAIILFYIGNEGISIIENAKKLDIPIPKFLQGKFLTFMEKNFNDKDDEQAT